MSGDLKQEYVDKWSALAVDEGEVEIEKIRPAINALYQRIGEPKPETIVLVDSPIAAKELAEQQPWAEKNGKILASDFCYGQHDADWAGHADHQFNGKGNKDYENMIPFITIAKNANWWLPLGGDHPGWIAVCRKPKVYMEEDVLHRDGGPSIEYADGWGPYHWKGVLCPKEFIDPPVEEVDAKAVLQHPNAEVRMAVIDRCGFGHFLEYLKPTTISSAKHAQLIEFEMADITEPVRALVLEWKDKFDKNKRTVLPVPRTAEEFVAQSVFEGDVPDNPDDAEDVRRWTIYARMNDNLVTET